MSKLIEDYALLGDLQTAALVGNDGAIEWLCLPRFDSPACLAALLDDDDHAAGSWQLAPTSGGACTRRRYRGDTLILETEWETPDGTVRIIDTMPIRGDAIDVVRLVEGVSGRVPMRMQLCLRFDYGQTVPWVRSDHGQLVALAGPDAAWLSTPVEVTGRNLTSVAEFEVAAGDRVPFVLTYHPSYLPQPEPVDAEKAIQDTEQFWTDWMAGLTYEGEWDEAVRRSLVTLKALTFEPTGGILAAATTSLPEEIGGSRNWDYRYCWLRDATFTLQALLGTGFVKEAAAWRDWLLRAIAGDPANLQIMYGIDGARRLEEYTADWLAGYEGSAPVRVGNAASDQFQLDTWGEVLHGLHLARTHGMAVDETAWDMQRALLDFLENHWGDADNGLWEVRGERQHFVHSKVLAWTGLMNAAEAVEEHGVDGAADEWRRLAAEIHDDVCRNGFDAERNTFTQFYGSTGLDAALLLIPRVGFLPWDDPRVVGTVDAVQRELSRDGFLLRYDPEADGGTDGLPGSEGAFVVCTFWLVDALHGVGREDEARALFERLIALRNDVGLLAEEVDPDSGRHLGNTPQAFSHVGLVNSALMLSSSPAVTAEPAG
ncbi:glycoside hydrolase family 15 protein [soil metagenome]